MLNIDLNDNPSVDQLEEQVRLLCDRDPTTNWLRIDNAAPGRGLVSHLKRIAQYIVKRPIFEVQVDQIDFLEHADTALELFPEEVPMGSIVLLTRYGNEKGKRLETLQVLVIELLSSGCHVITTGYR